MSRLAAAAAERSGSVAVRAGRTFSPQQHPTHDVQVLLFCPPLVGLVNALLRRASREALPESTDPAVAGSHPDWLVAALYRDWPDQVAAVLEANNRPAPMWLRVNPGQLGIDLWKHHFGQVTTAAEVLASLHFVVFAILMLPKAVVLLGAGQSS